MLFKELKIKPEHIVTQEDLKLLPMMDKYIVQANFDRLITQNWQKHFVRKARTSGSSGTPSIFLRDLDSINFENASIWYYWQQLGDHQSKRITLRGELFCPVEQEYPPFWKYNATDKELIMSSYHLSPKNMDAYIHKIIEFQPEVLYCYPSSGFLLAKLFKEAKMDYQFKYIFTSSEALDASIRSFVEEVFQSRIYDWYGQAERVAAIAQCENGNYHVQEHYSLVELVPLQHDEYEIIGTYFFNRAIPLIRYRTYDTVVSGFASCTCGSPFRTLRQVIGRPASYFITPDLRKVPNVQGLIMRQVQNIMEAQFYQETPDSFEIRIVPGSNYSEADREYLLHQARLHTDPRMDIRIVETPFIPRGPNGKFQSFINRIAEPENLNCSEQKPLIEAAY